MKEITPEKSVLAGSMKGANIFQYLNEKELDEIINLSQFYSFEAGEKVIEEGDVSAHLYLVINGMTEVYVKNDLGKSVYISPIGKGDVFGEAAIFLDVKRTANIIAKEHLEVLRISRTKFIHYIKYYPSAGVKILTLIIYSLLRKLREANQEIALERANTYKYEEVDSLIKEFLNADSIGTPRME